jgi:hypothetical protein
MSGARNLEQSLKAVQNERIISVLGFHASWIELFGYEGARR